MLVAVSVAETDASGSTTRIASWIPRCTLQDAGEPTLSYAILNATVHSQVDGSRPVYSQIKGQADAAAACAWRTGK